jgi:hypothetical protein
MLRVLLCLSLIFVVIGQRQTYPAPLKKLAGPPEEFEMMRTPSPSSVLTEVQSATQRVWFTPQADSNIVYQYNVPVDGVGQFLLTFSSPFEKDLQLSMLDPTGKDVNLASLAQTGFIPIGEEDQVPATSYLITEQLAGFYALTITSDLPKEVVKQLATSSKPQAIISVVGEDDVVIQTHLTNWVLKKGQEIGVISTIVDENPSNDPISFHITSAIMDVQTPDGTDEDIQMSDTYEGLAKFGYAPNDGIYGAHIQADEAGTYLVQASIKGWWTTATNQQIPFERSSQHVIQVSSATLELTGSSSIRTKDADHLLVDIAVTGTADQIRAYAEVLGTDPVTKQFKPACWLGGIVILQNGIVTLELDVNWLKLAGVNGPFKLQNVYVSDMVTSFPISVAVSEMAVEGSEGLLFEVPTTPITITEEMRFGVNPLPKPVRNSTAPGPNSLIALPGYCAGSNPWQERAGDFTNTGFFVMKKGNYNHQDFALLAIDYTLKLNPKPASFGLLGHSQGGCVAAHIANYFYSGLDYATGGYKITSVGTPFQGCTAAGGLADLGDIFGIGCGSNNDLSLDGSKAWLSGITAETRKIVAFYTTTYEQGKLFGDWCNLPINSILQWPNDGTTEIKHAPLPGGSINMGNTQKECHTTGMSYPPQYRNPTRNQRISAQSAR